jgi:hypothetical protein
MPFSLWLQNLIGSLLSFFTLGGSVFNRLFR